MIAQEDLDKLKESIKETLSWSDLMMLESILAF